MIAAAPASTQSIRVHGLAATPNAARIAGYYYHPSRHSAGQPIVAGWSYQLVAELGFEQDSWVTPADMTSTETEAPAISYEGGLQCTTRPTRT
jgi:hypothetical protein